jgi:large subunit ribosomal protein L25
MARKDITVTATQRDSRGKNEARRLRVQGKSPAVLYGSSGSDGGAAVAIAVDPKEVRKILHSKTGHNTIFNLSVKDGETVPVMIVDWQNEPIKDTLLHVDLKRIDLSRRIRVKVPVHTVGEPTGVKIQGGIHEVVTREIEIECLPDEIPEEYTIDVAGLSIGENVRASDLKLGGSAKLLSPADAVISHVVTIKAEAEPEAAAVEGAPAAAAEPEVIKKGKKEEEAAADDKKKK